MLSLLLMLSGLGRLTSAGHHPEPSLLQITVPRKIGTNTNDGEASETHVTYAIKIDRKRYTLHLEKQSFLDPHFLVYAYNKSGTLYPDSSFIKGHCLYQGYAAEVPKSVVTLSTCSGLRGLLLLQNVSYGIEPLESAAAYEHMLYQIKNNKIDFSPVQENYTMTQLVDHPYRILVKSEKNSDVLLKRVLKIQVVMDKALGKSPLLDAFQERGTSLPVHPWGSSDCNISSWHLPSFSTGVRQHPLDSIPITAWI